MSEDLEAAFERLAQCGELHALAQPSFVTEVDDNTSPERTGPALRAAACDYVRTLLRTLIVENDESYAVDIECAIGMIDAAEST